MQGLKLKIRIPNILRSLLYKNKFKLIRESMRGYHKLKEEGRLNLIQDLRIQIENKKIKKINDSYSKFLFFNSDRSPEIYVKQFLLVKLILDISLNQKLLASLASPQKKYILTLPVEWRDVLTNNNLKYKKILSEISWGLWILNCWFRSVIQILYFLYKSLINISRDKEEINSKTANFEGLSRSCLPIFNKEKLSYNIINWYLNWENRNKEISTIHHNVNDVEDFYVKDIRIAKNKNLHIIPPIHDLKTFLYIFAWGLWATMLTFMYLCLGRWWNSILLGELFRAKVVNMQPKELLSTDYLFQSNWIYRPLWTYEAEKKGSRVIFFFYSTNSEGFKTQYGYKPIDFDWRSLTWSHYLVWDSFQSNFLKQVLGADALIEVVGPIWFQEGNTELSSIANKSIAVFDVQPHRHSTYHALGATTEYYVPKICINFLKEIYEVARDCGYQLVWKRKRNIGKNLHPEFRRFIKNFSKLEGVIVVDAETSAVRVVNATKLSISMPYTSTALIAKSVGRHSCYYDASGMIAANDKGSHGVDVVSGVDNLKKWVLSH